MELRIRVLPVEADQQRGFSGALESSRRRVTELPKHEYIISSFQSRTRRDKSARLLEALDPTGLVDIAPYPSIWKPSSRSGRSLASLHSMGKLDSRKRNRKKDRHQHERRE